MYTVPGLYELAEEVEAAVREPVSRDQFEEWLVERDIMWRLGDRRIRIPNMWVEEDKKVDAETLVHPDQPPYKRQRML